LYFQDLKEYYEYQSSLGDIWASDGDGKAMDWLFIQTDGRLMHPSTPYGTFKGIIRKYNETAEEGRKMPEITLHGLRHTFNYPNIRECGYKNGICQIRTRKDKYNLRYLYPRYQGKRYSSCRYFG